MSEDLPPDAFELLSAAPVPGGALRHWRHRRSGAQVLRLADNRREACVSVSFRTPWARHDGAPHLLEHLVFRGSRGFPEADLYTALREGAVLSHLNATTSAMTTSFQLAGCLPEGLRGALRVMLDAVFCPLLRPEQLEAERAVIRQEMAAYFAAPRPRMEAALRQALFGRGPGGAMPGGLPLGPGGIAGADPGEVHGRFFHPRNAFIILTGAQDVTAAGLLLDEAFRRRLTAGAASRAGDLREDAESPGCFQPTVPVPGQPCALAWPLPRSSGLAHALLAGVLTAAAGADLLPGSGLREDGPRPWLQLLFRAGPPPEPEALAARISPEAVREAAETLAERLADPAADPRFPAGLQARERLLAAWMRGEDPVRVLQLPEALARVTADPRAAAQEVAALFRQVLRTPAVVTGVPEPLPPLAPRPGGAGAALSLPRAVGGLPQLRRRDLPSWPPEERVTRIGGIACLAGPGDPLFRIVLGVSLRGFSAEARELAASWAAVLPPPAGRLQLVAGRHPVLLMRLSSTRPGLLAERLKGLVGRLQQSGHRSLPPELSAAEGLEQALRAAFAPPGPVPRPADLLLRDRFAAAVSHPELAPLVAGVLADLPSCPPAGDLPGETVSVTGSLIPGNIGLAGRGADLSVLPTAVALAALALVESDWLRPQLRDSGQSYGLRAMLCSDGLATLVSVGDAAPERSLAIMAEAGAWLAGQRGGAPLADRAAMAAAARLLAPAPPGQRLAEEVVAQLTGRAPPADPAEGLAHLRRLRMAELRAAGEVLDAALRAGPALSSAPGR